MLITTSPNPTTYSLVNTQSPENYPISYIFLKWQQKQLIVKARKSQTPLGHLDNLNEEWLQKCLQKSPVKIVKIDPTVGVRNLETWAKASTQAKKSIFIRAGSGNQLPLLYPFRWRLKRICDFLVALFLLVILSPVILGFIAWQGFKSPRSPLFRKEWRVGKRGQLFQLLKFNTTSKRFKAWQNLPQLFNVLRGEMSLVGARPWKLTEVTQLQPKQLNNLPGITGISPFKAPNYRQSQ